MSTRHGSPAEAIEREAILDLLAEGRVSCTFAAQSLQVTRPQLEQLLEDRGLVFLPCTEDELQQKLEAIEHRERSSFKEESE